MPRVPDLGAIQDPARSRSDVRQQRVRAALADVLADMVEEYRYRAADPGEAARILRSVGLTAEAGRRLGMAIDGVAEPRTGAHADVEPADGQGTYGGMAGGIAQAAENHGQRVVAEVVAFGRAWLDQKNRPKLGDLLGAYYQARGAGDAAGAEALRAKIAADHGVDVGTPVAVEGGADFEEAKA